MVGDQTDVNDATIITAVIVDKVLPCSGRVRNPYGPWKIVLSHYRTIVLSYSNLFRCFHYCWYRCRVSRKLNSTFITHVPTAAAPFFSRFVALLLHNYCFELYGRFSFTLNCRIFYELYARFFTVCKNNPIIL